MRQKWELYAFVLAAVQPEPGQERAIGDGSKYRRTIATRTRGARHRPARDLRPNPNLRPLFRSNRSERLQTPARRCLQSQLYKGLRALYRLRRARGNRRLHALPARTWRIGRRRQHAPNAVEGLHRRARDAFSFINCLSRDSDPRCVDRSRARRTLLVSKTR